MGSESEWEGRIFKLIVAIVSGLIPGVFSLVPLITAAHTKVNSGQYFEIAADGSPYSFISDLLIAIGVIWFILGTIAIVGACCCIHLEFLGGCMCLYSVLLGVAGICALGGGIAAVVKQNDLEAVFRESSNTTFQNYNMDPSINATWDSFQQRFYCCAVNSWKDYQSMLGAGVVPQSCCNSSTVSTQECAAIHRNVTEAIVDQEYKINNQGCVNAVIDDVENNLQITADVAFAFGSLLILVALFLCTCAFCACTAHRKHWTTPYEKI